MFHSIIDKSYKLLFLLYAPVGILTIVLKFFSDIEISFIFLGAIIALVTSLFVAIWIVLLFFMHYDDVRKDQELHIPYLIRHEFLVMFIIVTTIALSVTAYSVLERFYKTDVVQNGEKEIVILAGLRGELDQKLPGSESIATGLGYFLSDHPDATETIKFTLINHKNTLTNDLQNIFMQKIKDGVSYFLCVYSTPCEKLAETLNLYVENSEITDISKPIFIATANGMSSFPAKRDQTYLIDIDLTQESRNILSHAMAMNYKKIAYIASDDAFGHQSIERLRNLNQNSTLIIENGIFLDPQISSDVAKREIQASKIDFSNIDALVIAHYGAGFEILETDEELKTKPIISFSMSKKPLELALSDSNRIFADTIDVKERQKRWQDPVATMVYISLDKLSNAAMTKSNSFDEVWSNTDYPPLVTLSKVGEAHQTIKVQETANGL